MAEDPAVGQGQRAQAERALRGSDREADTPRRCCSCSGRSSEREAASGRQRWRTRHERERGRSRRRTRTSRPASMRSSNPTSTACSTRRRSRRRSPPAIVWSGRSWRSSSSDARTVGSRARRRGTIAERKLGARLDGDPRERRARSRRSSRSTSSACWMRPKPRRRSTTCSESDDFDLLGDESGLLDVSDLPARRQVHDGGDVARREKAARTSSSSSRCSSRSTQSCARARASSCRTPGWATSCPGRSSSSTASCCSSPRSARPSTRRRPCGRTSASGSGASSRTAPSRRCTASPSRSG